MNHLWLDKYKPKKINEFINLESEINQIHKWLNCFTNKTPYTDFKNCLLISGKTGVGKSSLIETVLKENNYNILRFDASTTLSSEQIEQKIITVLSSQNILSYISNKGKTAIIIDELDEIDSKKEFGSSKIIELLSYSQNKFYKNKKVKKSAKKFIINNSPIICVSNGKFSKKLKQNSLFIRMSPPTNSSLDILISRILNSEKLKINKSVIQIIISISQNDYRRVINILEELYYYIKTNGNDKNSLIKKIYSIGYKDVNQSIFTDVTEIFSEKKTFSDIVNIIDNHNKNLLLFSYENFIPIINTIYRGSYKDKLKICIKFYNYFLYTNIFLDKMFNSWILQQYVPISLLAINNLSYQHQKTCRPIPQLRSPLIISKYNYRYYNLKYINSLSKKLNINMKNFYILSYLLYNILFNTNDELLIQYIKLYKNKNNLSNNDFLKIIKLSILPINIVITKKLDNKIKKLFMNN